MEKPLTDLRRRVRTRLFEKWGMAIEIVHDIDRVMEAEIRIWTRNCRKKEENG